MVDNKNTRVGKLKGFREFLPSEQKARKQVFDAISDVAERFGFREINTPKLEPMDLFLLKSGVELVEQTYSFKDKGGRDVTMVPEETPTRARMVMEHKELSTPVKWYSIGRFWRYENTQKGRLREFFQFNADIYGAGSVEADAEMIALAVGVLEELGLQDTAVIRLNDRQLLESIISTYGITDTETVLRIVDDKEKTTRDAFRSSLIDEGLSEKDARIVDEVTELKGRPKEVLKKLDTLIPNDERSNVAYNRITDLVDKLAMYDVIEHCRLDLSIVRGLAYYTGLVFEIFDAAGDLRAISGGGRYDDLIETMGGSEVPAVGFGIGDATLELLMRQAEVWPEETVETDVYVLPVSDEVTDAALSIVRRLRDQELDVETDLTGRNFGNQLAYANTINAETVVIVGERDLANDEVTVKEMASGDEEQVAFDAVDSYLS